MIEIAIFKGGYLDVGVLPPGPGSSNLVSPLPVVVPREAENYYLGILINGRGQRNPPEHSHISAVPPLTPPPRQSQ